MSLGGLVGSRTSEWSFTLVAADIVDLVNEERPVTSVGESSRSIAPDDFKNKSSRDLSKSAREEEEDDEEEDEGGLEEFEESENAR